MYKYDEEKINRLVLEWKEQPNNKTLENLIKEARIDTLINAVVRKFTKKHLKEDLIQECYIYIYKLLDRYDLTRSIKLRAYLYIHLDWELREHVKQDRIVPIATKGKRHLGLASSYIPNSHSEVASLAQQKNVTYKTALKYTMMSKVFYSDHVFDEDDTRHPCHIAPDVDICLQVEALRLLERLPKMYQVKSRDRRYLSAFPRNFEMFIHQALGDSNMAIGRDFGVSGESVRNATNLIKKALAL